MQLPENALAAEIALPAAAAADIHGKAPANYC